jgi:hypothetical protein
MCERYCDTHYYDNKLNLSELKGLEKIKHLSFTKKISLANDLLLHLKDIIAISFLKKIIVDFGKDSNLDKTNELIADDLICLCWFHRNNIDFIECLETQLNDMSTGFCPQGRTHRLFQILIAFCL